MIVYTNVYLLTAEYDVSFLPKVIVPRHRLETTSPDLPKWEYSTLV
jgi:hypothetical protein